MEKNQKIPKILHVVISMTVGGAEKLIFDMVQHEAFMETKPVICCLDECGEFGQELIDQNYKVFVKNRKSGIDWSLISWLREIIKSEDVEIVHAHQYTPLFYSYLAKGFSTGVKLVYTEHGRFFPEQKSWKRSLVNPLLALGVNHLVSISHATADAMSTYDNLPRKRIKVIHNGMEAPGIKPLVDRRAKLEELGLSDSCRILGTAARLNSIKNIQMMIRGLKMVLETYPETILVIAGQGEEEVALRSVAADLGVSNRVKFIGLRFDLDEIYQLFDVFLLTSFSEGISVTLLEAMSHGIPAVVTAVGGNCEVVVEGETGYLVAVDDDETLANRVCKLISSPSLGKAMGDAAQVRARTSFSRNKMMEEYFRLYSD